MSALIFDDQFHEKTVLQAEVPVGIQSEAVLMDALYNALRLPDYFGGNWDALDECICDLSWLPPGDVILKHKDLPLSENRKSLSIYLDVLKCAVEEWSTNGSNLIFASPEKWDASGERESLVKRNFFAMFPPNTEATVRSILAEA